MKRRSFWGIPATVVRGVLLLVMVFATAVGAVYAAGSSSAPHAMKLRPPVKASAPIRQPTNKFVCGVVAKSGIAEFISEPIGDLPGTKPRITHVINQPNTCMLSGDYGHNMVILTIVAGSKRDIAKQYAIQDSTSQYSAYELDRIHLKAVPGYRFSFASYTPESETTKSGQIIWIAPNGKYLVELHFSWLIGGHTPDTQVQMIREIDTHLLPNPTTRSAGSHVGLAGLRPSKPDRRVRFSGSERTTVQLVMTSVSIRVEGWIYKPLGA